MTNMRFALSSFLLLVLLSTGATAATLCVPDTSPGGCDSTHATIGAAILAASPGDTIKVAAGSFSENLTLNKQLTLLGAQAGVTACGRLASESTVAPPSLVALTLVTGSAGSVIDGFTFSGGTRAIESASGPLDNIVIRNNRIVAFTNAGIFLNDSGTDVTIHQNLVDGTSKTGGGGLLHLDQDSFDGFHLTYNCIVNGATGTGFFVDGNHNVGVSAGRSPLIQGNVVGNNNTGTNLGSRSFEYGTISDNVFEENNFDGLQGGPQNSTITRNVFDGNGRSGLSLTSFGNTGLDRGAQNSLIVSNFFTANSTEAIFLSSAQPVGTIATNTFRCNAIFGNTAGMTYNGTESITAENNWWGCNAGPGNTGCDTLAGTGAGGIDVDPWLVMSVSANPNLLAPGQTATITADFTLNSDGAAPGCTLPDGVPVTFTGGACGSVDPVVAATLAGLAETTFTATCGSGTAGDITAQAGGEAVPISPPVQFQTLPIPALSSVGLTMLALLLGALAAGALFRRPLV